MVLVKLLIRMKEYSLFKLSIIVGFVLNSRQFLLNFDKMKEVLSIQKALFNLFF